MKKHLILVVFLVALLGQAAMVLAGEGAVPASESKQTTLGNYVNAAEAYEKWKANPDGIKILDVRTPEEYFFVGHAAMARNVPAKVWANQWNGEKKTYVLTDNPDFDAKIKELYKTEDVILVMCRSGGRSAEAVNRMATLGFTKVFNIVDGFEGDKVKDEDSYFDGKRMKNGWKNSGAPWTYSMNPDLVFVPAK